MISGRDGFRPCACEIDRYECVDKGKSAMCAKLAGCFCKVVMQLTKITAESHH